MESSLPSQPTKKKRTILRVKRKFSEIQGDDVLVLSRPKAKRARTIPWSELTECLNSASLSTEAAATNGRKPKATAIPNFFDYDFSTRSSSTQSSKKQVFRLIGRTRQFQSTNPQPCATAQRKDKLLQQRRDKRAQHLSSMKQRITNPQSKTTKPTIIAHEDDSDESGPKSVATTSKPGANQSAKRVCAVKSCYSQPRKKRVPSRGIKIATRAQLRAMNAAKQSSNVNWTAEHKTAQQCTQNDTSSRDDFDGRLPKFLDHIRQQTPQLPADYDIIDMEFDATNNTYTHGDPCEHADEHEYDYYELDEDADHEQVIAAIQFQIKHKKQLHQEALKREMNQEDEGEMDEDEVKLEKKLDAIKQKHLMKHFDAGYEGPRYASSVDTSQKEVMRLNEMQRSEYMDHEEHDEWLLESKQVERYYEKVMAHDADEEEMNDQNDERYMYNEYPDEHELSDDEEYRVENDYYPADDCSYRRGATDNALDIDFFASYDFK